MQSSILQYQVAFMTFYSQILSSKKTSVHATPANYQSQINFSTLYFRQCSVPNEFQPVGKYNIGFTAVTEGDICPKEWIECINRMQYKKNLNVTIWENGKLKSTYEGA